jgi:hypothetical protein
LYLLASNVLGKRKPIPTVRKNFFLFVIRFKKFLIPNKKLNLVNGHEPIHCRSKNAGKEYLWTNRSTGTIIIPTVPYGTVHIFMNNFRTHSNVSQKEQCYESRSSRIINPEPMQKNTKLKNIMITTKEVKKRIDKLKTQSSPGLDGITPRLLKETKVEKAPLLARIFRESLRTGVIPRDWKEAKVVPIFKKGSKTSAGNYRPVSLTSICCRIMEGMIRDEISEHLQTNRLLHPSQHGFMKNKSCTTNLLEFTEKIREAADRGEPMDVIYLDFAKAFDKVPTERLLKKLQAHGVTGHVHRWIRAWLTGRHCQ